MKLKISRITYLFLLLIVWIFAYQEVGAQNSKTSKTDVSQIKASQISDTQMEVLMQRAMESGYTPDQIESLARSKGMSENDIKKFRERAELYYNTNGTSTDKYNQRIYTRPILEFPEDLEERLKSQKEEPKRDQNFGFNLFQNTDLTFEPSFNISTPKDYLIGPGDIVNIDVWGASQHSYQEVISNEGSILISNVGPVFLNGLTIDQAEEKLKNKLGKIYSGLDDGQTYLMITLGSVRSIQINIIGDVVLPGTYTISSLATAFNALYLAGGPTDNGSLRDVQVIRDNKVIAHIDVYEYLLKGQHSANPRLQDQDIVFVPPYSTRVSVSGEIKREMQFDIQPTESLEDLINYAGGFTGNAYTDRIKIFRKTGKEKRVLDIEANYLDAIKLDNGDEVLVDSVLNRFENRVYITGAVFRPGVFSVDDNTTLKELIVKADGLREDVYKGRISVFRLNDDLSKELIALDLNELMNSNLDFQLQREDSVRIPSIHDLREERIVKIEGEIGSPGVYEYSENMNVEDLIIQAGGLLEGASTSNIEISRRVQNDTLTSKDNKLADIIIFPISKSLELNDSASNFILKPFDQVFIRKSPSYTPQMIVSIEGEVNFPGRYAIKSRTERISDLLIRSGGITKEAYLNGASLIRKKTEDKQITDRAIDITIQKDSTNNIDIKHEQFDIIAVNLADILKNPGGLNDLYLQEGDSIRILKFLQTVKVSGSVYSPNVIPYQKNFDVRDYLTNAGGVTNRSKPGHIYVVYANGAVQKTKRSLFVKKYPKIEPGAEIIVPGKPEREKMSTAGLVSIATSLSLVLVTFINTR